MSPARGVAHGVTSPRNGPGSPRNPTSPTNSGKRSDVAPHAWILDEVALYDRNLPLRQGSSPECAAIIAHMGKWTMDTFSFSNLPEVHGSPLASLTQGLMHEPSLRRRVGEFGLIGSLPETALSPGGSTANFQHRVYSYVEKVERCYADTSFHNSLHAGDVMATVEVFMQTTMMQSFCGPLDHLVSLLAAAVHDVGHTGKNNAFHVNIASTLALRYNDRSVLENMHAALSFEVMKLDERCNWRDLLSTESKSYVRKLMTSMILMTDMAHHQELVGKFKAFIALPWVQSTDGSATGGRAVKAELPELSEREHAADKQLLLDVVLHLSDVSNPCKPLPQALIWTRNLLQEFWGQGDEEARLGMPITMLCNRASDSASVPAGQIGFINFVIAPAYRTLLSLMPEAEEAVENMDKNVSFWSGKKEEGATYEQIFGEWTGNYRDGTVPGLFSSDLAGEGR